MSHFSTQVALVVQFENRNLTLQRLIITENEQPAFYKTKIDFSICIYYVLKRPTTLTLPFLFIRNYFRIFPHTNMSDKSKKLQHPSSVSSHDMKAHLAGIPFRGTCEIKWLYRPLIDVQYAPVLSSRPAPHKCHKIPIQIGSTMVYVRMNARDGAY